MKIYKETMPFSVHGDDKLLLDKYDSYSSEQLAQAIEEGHLDRRSVLLFAVGGGFARGHRDRLEYIGFFEKMVRAGYLVLSIDYRQEVTRMGTKDFITPNRMMDSFYHMVESAMEDYCDATRFLLSHADEWHIDPARVIAGGSSAGAITVLQLAYECSAENEKVLQWLPSPTFRYAALLSFSGAICIKGDKAEIKRLPPPVMMVHGNQDAIVPFDKAMVPLLGGFAGSKAIFRMMEGYDVSRQLIVVRGGNHEVSVLAMYRFFDQIMQFLDHLNEKRDNTIPFDLDQTIFPQPLKELFPKVLEPRSHGNYLASYIEESPAEMKSSDLRTKRYTTIEYLIVLLRGFVMMQEEPDPNDDAHQEPLHTTPFE